MYTIIHNDIEFVCVVEDVLSGQVFLLEFQCHMTNDIARTYLNLNMYGHSLYIFKFKYVRHDIVVSFHTPPGCAFQAKYNKSPNNFSLAFI